MIFLRSAMRSLLLAGVLTTQPLSAFACALPENVAVSTLDTDRMNNFYRSRSQALAETLVAPSGQERTVVHGLFSGGDGFIDTIPDGEYRCRTIKLGGDLSPLTIYGYFECRIGKGGTRIVKSSGSQRFSGTLTPSDRGVFYRGAQHYGDEQPLAYDADPQRNQVGCIYRVIEETGLRYRMELPFPHFESTHDVIELIPKD